MQIRQKTRKNYYLTTVASIEKYLTISIKFKTRIFQLITIILLK